MADFYEEAIGHLGGLCERTWYDRLQIVAEGPSARPWNGDGSLHAAELRFCETDDSGPRDAAREVFPGCPLTFRLFEALLTSPTVLERAVLSLDPGRPPTPEVAEKLWHTHPPEAGRWRMQGSFRPSHHFSLLALARCEIQAIDQHWSLHRVAISLPNGEMDEALAAAMDFAELTAETSSDVIWPATDAGLLRNHLGAALGAAIAPGLDSIRLRQESHLRRELNRIDDYFMGYERELSERGARSRAETARIRVDDRLSAARAEHARRREDQVRRHEIRVLPRVDALLMLAEPAWRADVSVTDRGGSRSQSALFVPRSRRWFAD